MKRRFMIWIQWKIHRKAYDHGFAHGYHMAGLSAFPWPRFDVYKKWHGWHHDYFMRGFFDGVQKFQHRKR